MEVFISGRLPPISAQTPNWCFSWLKCVQKYPIDKLAHHKAGGRSCFVGWERLPCAKNSSPVLSRGFQIGLPTLVWGNSWRRPWRRWSLGSRGNLAGCNSIPGHLFLLNSMIYHRFHPLELLCLPGKLISVLWSSPGGWQPDFQPYIAHCYSHTCLKRTLRFEHIILHGSFCLVDISGQSRFGQFFEAN